jgi:alpha-ketoglutarate-dependent taurine dioxygenase
MLFHHQDLAPGIGRFIFPNIWNDRRVKITNILDEFYGDQTDEGFYPHENDIALRQAILSSIPDLDALNQNVETLKRSGYCAFIFEQIELQSFSSVDRNKLLYALSLCLGYPTPTDPRQGKLLWDVKARPLPPGYVATFSEHSERAELHTDTQYYPQPEEYFLLYAVRGARCGGGKSILCNAYEIRERLLETADGREAFQFLSTYWFPFRIPTIFTKEAKVDLIETTLAPIFSDRPLIRFRYDTLEKGFKARPDLDIPEARQALRMLFHVLENKINVLNYYLYDDSLLLCNNHVLLHGRTSYLDKERHLIRVRMSKSPDCNLTTSGSNLRTTSNQLPKLY